MTAATEPVERKTCAIHAEVAHQKATDPRKLATGESIQGHAPLHPEIAHQRPANLTFVRRAAAVAVEGQPPISRQMFRQVTTRSVHQLMSIALQGNSVTHPPPTNFWTSPGNMPPASGMLLVTSTWAS